MGPNGCGCSPSGMANGNPFAGIFQGIQSGSLGFQPSMMSSAFLLDAATVDLTSLRSPANLEVGLPVLGPKTLTSCVLDGTSGFYY
jgi:hypothetical protein